MRHGINRRPFQTLPVSGEKITCVQYEDDSQATEEWMLASTGLWWRSHPIHRWPGLTKFQDWQFVLIVPLKTVRECWTANDGMTAWRFRLGYVVPDLCRQEGGCPEVWHIDSIKKKRELRIENLAEIEEYIVLPDHKQVTRGPFAEMNLQFVCAR